jgi:hypothetical protein
MYKNKYLKYKNKYLELKNKQIGGESGVKTNLYYNLCPQERQSYLDQGWKKILPYTEQEKERKGYDYFYGYGKILDVMKGPVHGYIQHIKFSDIENKITVKNKVTEDIGSTFFGNLIFALVYEYLEFKKNKSDVLIEKYEFNCEILIYKIVSSVYSVLIEKIRDYFINELGVRNQRYFYKFDELTIYYVIYTLNFNIIRDKFIILCDKIFSGESAENSIRQLIKIKIVYCKDKTEECMVNKSIDKKTASDSMIVNNFKLDGEWIRKWKENDMFEKIKTLYIYGDKPVNINAIDGKDGYERRINDICLLEY